MLRGSGNFGGCLSTEKHWESAAVYAKTAEPIEMPFRGGAGLTLVDPRNHNVG